MVSAVILLKGVPAVVGRCGFLPRFWRQIWCHQQPLPSSSSELYLILQCQKICPFAEALHA